MKNPVGLIVTILIIVLPIVWCCINLVNVNKEYDSNVDKMNDLTNEINNIIEDNVNQNNKSGDTYIGSMDGETYESSIGKPIGKIIENATVNETVNVYLDPDESSSIVGTVNKDTVVTMHNYPDNWTRIKVGSLSGWVRSNYITVPDDTDTTTLGTVIGKNGTVNVDSLNVRESASTSATIIQTFTLDTEVKILAVSEDKNWYQVQWRNVLGWVSAQYITVQY